MAATNVTPVVRDADCKQAAPPKACLPQKIARENLRGANASKQRRIPKVELSLRPARSHQSFVAATQISRRLKASCRERTF